MPGKCNKDECGQKNDDGECNLSGACEFKEESTPLETLKEEMKNCPYCRIVASQNEHLYLNNQKLKAENDRLKIKKETLENLISKMKQRD